MTTFTKIAWRNIKRNTWRSSITISAVSIGLAALIFLKSFVDGADMQMVENYTNLLIGHIQIHKSGFQKNNEIENSITNSYVITSVLKNIGGISSLAPRIKDYTLISSSEGSSGILLLGISPEAEQKLSDLHKRLRKGKFLKSGLDSEIIIGTTLAENLKVDLGDKVVLMSQGSDGSMAAAAYNVYGIVESGAEEIDKNLALITLKAAQELLVMGNKISEIVVKADKINSIDALSMEIKNNLDTNRFEVLTWKEVSPMTYQWLQFDQVFTDLILFIVLIVVASGILNTVLMGVMERIREFGIMLALGTKPQQISGMVTIESFLLGLIGTFFGTCIGTGLVFFFSIRGIDLSIISSALNNFYIGSIIYPRLDVISIAFYSSVVLLVSIFISVIPAKKASRLSPIEAIRHI
jgi:ABC-type lipoprotein release transport system permease subunit